MKSQDWMSKDNNRQDAIDRLITLCIDNGWSYSYTDRHFTVELPGVDPLPTEVDIPKPKRKHFNTDGWPTSEIDESHHDHNEPLDEGETPE